MLLPVFFDTGCVSKKVLQKK